MISLKKTTQYTAPSGHKLLLQSAALDAMPAFAAAKANNGKNPPTAASDVGIVLWKAALSETFSSGQCN
jgi:hypothetical protein